MNIFFNLGFGVWGLEEATFSRSGIFKHQQSTHSAPVHSYTASPGVRQMGFGLRG